LPGVAGRLYAGGDERCQIASRPRHQRRHRARVAALLALLSELGRDAVYPPDIPHQAAQARGKRFNATIGQITDGHGQILAPPALLRQLASLDGDRNAALLYSPIEGKEALRRRWRERHRPAGSTAPSSLPLVVAGLTHGLSLVADLFCDRGRAVVIPAPFWGNYRQIFTLRRGGRVVPAEVYRAGRFDPAAIGAVLDALPHRDPAIVLLNLPANPVGYSPTAAESDRLVETLVQAATRRPLLVVCDDAYAGLVYEDEVPRESLFWRLAPSIRDWSRSRSTAAPRRSCSSAGGSPSSPSRSSPTRRSRARSRARPSASCAPPSDRRSR
jgi:aspartate/methionine/tyrosine aminotransferase